jgi:hypothetical protein
MQILSLGCSCCSAPHGSTAAAQESGVEFVCVLKLSRKYHFTFVQEKARGWIYYSAVVTDRRRLEDDCTTLLW